MFDSRHEQEQHVNREKPVYIRPLLLTVFVFVGIGIAVAGTIFSLQREESLAKRALDQLSSVAVLKVTEIDGEPACFVRDNGVGFAMDEAERLFVPFERLPGTRDFRGCGIDLATVERIIHHHGGRGWAEGEPGKGAAFFFTLG